MNLHLAPDQKFLDMVIHNQKLYAPKTRNKYAIFLPKGQVAPVHTKSAEVIAIPHSERKNIESFLGDLSAFQTIYLHSIIPEYYSVVKKQPNLKYAWVLMGSEVFRASIFESYVYEPITEQIFIQYIKNKVRLSANPISFLKSIYRVFNQGLQEKKMSFIMKKCCYFCHFNPMDLEIIRERVNLNTKLIMYSCMTALQ